LVLQFPESYKFYASDVNFDLRDTLCYRQPYLDYSRADLEMNILPLVYQFVIGGFIFFIGFVLSWKSGDYSKKRKNDRLVSLYMIFGFFFYLVVQVIWHILASAK